MIWTHLFQGNFTNIGHLPYAAWRSPKATGLCYSHDTGIIDWCCSWAKTPTSLWMMLLEQPTELMLQLRVRLSSQVNDKLLQNLNHHSSPQVNFMRQVGSYMLFHLFVWDEHTSRTHDHVVNIYTRCECVCSARLEVVQKSGLRGYFWVWLPKHQTLSVMWVFQVFWG